MTPLTGFNPGVDPLSEGVVIDCSNILPTTKGLMSARSGDRPSIDAVPASVIEADSLTLLDGSARTFAGTTTYIYELIGDAWQNHSNGSGYSTGIDEKWYFAQFGNITLATNYTNEIQKSETSGLFSDLDGSPPRAKIIAIASGFVMVFDYVYDSEPVRDGWWCSGLYNHTEWTPNVSTQAANGRLLDTPGNIVAAKALGSAVVAYKENSIYIGQYVGPPVIWAWNQITNDAGAYSQDSVVSTDSKHYFLGPNGLFVYDGSRPIPIGAIEVRDWLKSNINLSFTKNIKGAYDRKTSLIFFFYPSIESDGSCDQALVYNTITGAFGRYTKTVKALLNYVSSSPTWAQLGEAPFPATWGSWSDSIIWNSVRLQGGDVGISFVDSSNYINKMISGDYLDSSITTGDIGHDTYFSTLSGVRLRFIKSPSSASITNFSKNQEGDDLIQWQTSSMHDGKVDMLRSARFHRLKINMTGEHEITGYEPMLKQNGTR